MESYTQSAYLDLLLVTCGFLIVLITRFSFSDFEEEKLELDDDSFPSPRSRRFSYHHSPGFYGSNPGSSSRRHSFSYSPSSCYTKRRGRRTFGIKHL